MRWLNWLLLKFFEVSYLFIGFHIVERYSIEELKIKEGLKEGIVYYKMKLCCTSRKCFILHDVVAWVGLKFCHNCKLDTDFVPFVVSSSILWSLSAISLIRSNRQLCLNFVKPYFASDLYVVLKFCQTLKVHLKFCQILKVHLKFCQILKISSNFVRFWRCVSNFVRFWRFPQILSEFEGWSQILPDFEGWSQILPDFEGWSQVWSDL